MRYVIINSLVSTHIFIIMSLTNFPLFALVFAKQKIDNLHLQHECFDRYASIQVLISLKYQKNKNYILACNRWQIMHQTACIFKTKSN